MGKHHEQHWALPNPLGYSLKTLELEVPVLAVLCYVTYKNVFEPCRWRDQCGTSRNSKMQEDGWAYLLEKLHG
jgi:hypothetical protein